MSADDPLEPGKPDASNDEDATRYIRAPANTGVGTRIGAAASASAGPRNLEPGQILAHTYEIEARLGRGGMGEVYRARHIKLHSLHAIKVIAPELVNDARVVEMFTEEARKLRLVRHDAVVSYDGLIGDENGLLYLIMEFVDGVSLAKVIRERTLAPDELRRLRDRLAQGLSAAHDKLIYHRDISPDNIILVDGRVEQAKIIDFGIAKSAAAGDRTIIGSDFAGKYSYVSPEQLGMFGGEVDGRSDIYSLGLVLSAAGLGHALDMGNSPATAVEARRHIPDLTPLPAALRTELEPLLEPDPADRPRSMRELPGSGDSASTAKAAPRSQARAKAPARAAPAAPRSRLPLIAAGLLCLIVAGGGGAYFLWPRTTPSSAPGATVPPVAATNPPPPLASAPSTTPAPLPVALPSTPPPAALDPQAVGLRLSAIARSLRCADLKPDLTNAQSPTIVGFVTSADDQGRLAQMLGDLPSLQRAASAVAVHPWAPCGQTLKAVEDAGAFDNLAAAPQLAFNNPGLDYHLGDKLILRITDKASADGYLYVDFLDSVGNIAHLLPRPGGPSNAIRAGQTITLGESKDSVLEIAEPIGPNLILAVFSPQRLFAARNDETAQNYLPVLNRSLAAATQNAGAMRPSASYAFVYALAR